MTDLSSSTLFGRTLGYDPHLLIDLATLGALAIRGRHDRSITLFDPNGRMITVATPEMGRGPQRILVAAVPAPTVALPTESWELTRDALRHPRGPTIPFAGAEIQPSDRLPPLRDVPGHMHNRLRRVEPAAEVKTELLERLQRLFLALGTPEAEALEKPVLDLVGFGPGATPSGDDALAGLILTGRAYTLGRRQPVGWLSPLILRVFRLLHRTTAVSAAYLRYAFAGRTTALQEDLFVAMARDLETQNDRVVTQMLQFGATSGADFLVGVRFGLDLIKSRLGQSLISLVR